MYLIKKYHINIENCENLFIAPVKIKTVRYLKSTWQTVTAIILTKFLGGLLLKIPSSCFV